MNTNFKTNQDLQIRGVDQTPYQPWHSPLRWTTNYAHGVVPLLKQFVENLPIGSSWKPIEKVHTHTQPGGLGVQGNFLDQNCSQSRKSPVKTLDPLCRKLKNVCTGKRSKACPWKESRWWCHNHWIRSELEGLSSGGQLLWRSWRANFNKLFSSTVEAVAVKIIMRAPGLWCSSALSSIKIHVSTCKSKSDWWKASEKFVMFLDGGTPCWLCINSGCRWELVTTKRSCCCETKIG